MTLSLGQAAVAVGISKPTIQRAIKNGKLSASRNEDGSYSIDESELARVYPDQWRNRYVAGTLKQAETLSNPDALQAEIEGLRQQLAMLRDERDDLRRRLDAEAEERRRLTRLLTDQRAAVSVQVEKPGGGLADWWRRLWSG
jgi:excisionase family DNA binding protein